MAVIRFLIWNLSIENNSRLQIIEDESKSRFDNNQLRRTGFSVAIFLDSSVEKH